MHRLPTQQSVNRFLLAASLLLLKCLLVPGALALLAYSLIVGDRDLTHLSFGVAGGTVLLTIIQWITAARVRCPLCLGFPLTHSACVKNHSARRFLGSYRLRVALSVILEGNFRCQYCGESTAIEVRRHHRRRRSSSGRPL
jgi:hypothetical protein